MPFQSFQSGCGTCNNSTDYSDYSDIYYRQSGAGKKKRSTEVKKKKSTKPKVVKKKSTMHGGVSEEISSFQLDDQFISDNLGIPTNTGGGATYMDSRYYKGNMLDSLRTGTMSGYDQMEGVQALVGSGKKKKNIKKKTISENPLKKLTKKIVKKVSKKKTSKKIAPSSWKFW